MSAPDAEARERLGKLFGILGSEHAGERANAVSAIDQALTRSGWTWSDVGQLIARGELPNDEREKLLARLVADRLRAGLKFSWMLTGTQSKHLRELVARSESGFADVSTAALERAIAIVETARRQAAL